MRTLQDLYTGFLMFRENLKAPELDDSVLFLDYCRRNLHISNAQFFQDLFVLYVLNGKRGGYFVEFGACDGVAGSNSLILEKSFGWQGILAEPGRCWHDDLKKNRSCHIDLRCIWGVGGEVLSFNEVTRPGLAGLSTVDSYSLHDGHGHLRDFGNKYSVETISLNELLDLNAAPSDIDYISVDTEGSELSILKNFDFGRYNVKIFTVEHNYTDQRADIFSLMVSKGYRRCFESFSSVDDWYVKN